MKRIHYLLLGLLVSLTIAAVSPTSPPTRLTAGSGITIVTNGVNNFTLSAGGGVSSSNGLSTNLSVYSSGTTNPALRVFLGTQTNSNPLDISGVWNAAGITFTGLKLNITNTASASASMLMDLQQDGSSVFSVLRDAGGVRKVSLGSTYGSFRTYAGNASGAVLGYNDSANGGVFLGASAKLGANAGDGSGAIDVALSRTAAGVWEINTGTASTYRDLVVRSLFATNVYATNILGRVGTSTNTFKAGGTLAVDTTQTGNVGAGVDALQYYSIRSNSLAANGDTLTFQVAGTFAASVNTKAITIVYGGTTILDTGAVATTASGSWLATGSITRTGASAQKCVVHFSMSDTPTLVGYPTYSATAISTTAGADFYVNGEGTDNNDIVKEVFRLKYEPAP